MGGAPLLLAMAVVMVDPGWESIGPGQYRYIIQVTPEQFETLKAERKLTSRIPENLRGQITEVEIRFGDGPLPRPEVIAASDLQETAFPVSPQDYPRPPDELQPNTMRGQDGGDNNFQIPSTSPSTSPRTTPGTTPSTGPNGGTNRNPAAGPATNFQIPTTPNTTQPNTTRPNTTRPNTTRPDTTRPDTTRPNTTRPNTAGNNASADPYGPTPPPSWSRDAATNPAATGGNPRYAATNSSNSQPGTDPPSMNDGGVDSRGLSEINRRGARPTQPTSTQTLSSQTNSSQTNSSQTNSDETYKFWDRRSGMTPAEQRQSDQRLVAEVTSNQSGQLIDRSTLRPLAADDPRFRQMLDYLVRIGEITVAEERSLLDWAENLLNKERAAETQRNPTRTAQLATPPGGYPASSLNTPTSSDSRTLEELRIREQLLQEQLATERLTRERLAQLGAATTPKASLPVVNQAAADPSVADQAAAGQRQQTANTNRQAEGATSRGGRFSPSDEEPLVRNQAQLESRPLINFFLLFSLVANAYLMLAISRLIRRYRNLVATNRAGNGSLTI